jgi:hypothetical protein
MVTEEALRIMMGRYACVRGDVEAIVVGVAP